LTTLKFDAATKLATELLMATGMAEDEAESSATCIVASDAWGIGSHGLMRLPFYLERLQAGGINPKAKLKEITNLPALRVFDGESGLGHWQVKKAADVATNIANEQGIAAVGIGRSNHCGALGIYVWPMLKENLVGIIFSNGPAVMPPWGGNKPILSTSPIAAGIPTAPPTIIDLATSAVARGKIAAKAQKNEELEPGWAFDSDGNPTLDAKVALAGMLAPLGGVKGYALAILVESLTGALIGPKLASEIPDMFDNKQAALTQDISHFVIAIKSEALSVDGKVQLAELSTNIEAAGGRLPGKNRRNPFDISQGHDFSVADSVAVELEKWSKRLL
jgi:(2R)-3-sulfolactate dehydrogenase (NADP+)